MLVIYDLDKTSLYCPIADWMDKFIPKNRFLKKLYYNLYPFVHILEDKLGLLQINENIYKRAKSYYEMEKDLGMFYIHQVVITARHYSSSIPLHVKKCFKDVHVDVICIAQGLTNINKCDIVEEMPLDEHEEIIMFDDNQVELYKMRTKFRPRFTGVNLLFKDNKETIISDYRSTTNTAESI